MKKPLLLCALLLMVVVGCAHRGVAAPETPPVNSGAPISSDDPPLDLTVVGSVDGAEVQVRILVMESYPV